MCVLLDTECQMGKGAFEILRGKLCCKDLISWEQEKITLKYSGSQKIFHPDAVPEKMIKFIFVFNVHCLFLFFFFEKSNARFQFLPLNLPSSNPCSCVLRTKSMAVPFKG